MINPTQENIKMIHINKTGGTSVINWLLPVLEVDASTDLTDKGTSNSSHRIIETFIDEYFYFTIVRNPYDRLASHYFQWETQGKHRDERWWSDDVKDLNDFITKTYNDSILHVIKKKYLYRHQPEYLLPCTDWILDFNKVKIFKTEELHELVKFFRHHFKNDAKWNQSELEVDTATKTKGLKSYKHLYNEESKSIIKKVFDSDFKNFGYEK